MDKKAVNESEMNLTKSVILIDCYTLADIIANMETLYVLYLEQKVYDEMKMISL